MRYFVYCRKSSEAEDRQVLSIDSQEAEIRKTFGSHTGITIAGIFREAYSAKAPGRPVFDEMLTRIERGEAEGLITWHPDRLARNSVDGGRIVYLLDRNKLKDLKFATFTFENNPQGKFMLAITFGYSKYYVDSLSENVKRGNRAKIEKGWRPNMAPIGYRNDKDTKTIQPDPEQFPYIRKFFDLILFGRSVREIVAIANEDWGYRTPKRKRTGGGPLPASTAYRMLTNPFYAGYILWGGQLYPGKHEPVVSLAEFERVQQLLGRPTRPKPKRHTFAYTGLIRCGACGLQVTAEHKVNRYGSRYVYYHCTRKHRMPNCTQPSIEEKALEAQLRAFLHSITLPDSIHDWTLRQLGKGAADRAREQELRVRSLENAIEAVGKQLSNLTDLRLRGLLADDEFLEKREALQRERYRLEEARMGDDPAEALEPERMLLLFSNRALLWFDRGDADVRRRIVGIASSNLLLRDKKLKIEAKKPFVPTGSELNIPNQLAGVDDARTLPIWQIRAAVPLLRRAHRHRKDPDLNEMLTSIKALVHQCEVVPLQQAA